MVWPASSTSTRISTRATSGRAARTRTAPSPARSMRSRAIARRTGPPRTSRARMDFALRCAYAHGTARDPHASRLRCRRSTHLLAGVRRDARALGRPDRAAGRLARRHRRGPRRRLRSTPSPTRRRARRPARRASPSWCRISNAMLDALCPRRRRAGLDLDLHVDETRRSGGRCAPPSSPTPCSATRFQGRIIAGHCCSLAVQAERRGRRDHRARRRGRHRRRLAADVQPLPAGPRRAGTHAALARRHAAARVAARGVPVAIASDNTRDPFYAYGDLDVLEVLREARASSISTTRWR